MNTRLVFIIAHKFIRGYKSYTKYYIDTIQKFYPDALTIVVDNNSVNKNDVFDTLKDYQNVILLDNNISCKFEIGAYQVAFKYLIDNNLVANYDYCICTQDNFILKNKYDFDQLRQKNITACPINGGPRDNDQADIVRDVLSRLNLYDNVDKITLCWCISFIINTCHVQQLYNYFKEIVITVRKQSCASERYLSRILWELNGKRDCGEIDGNKSYDPWRVNLFEDQTSYFAKSVQQKTEKTME
jgi:hypothetical protein